MPASLVAVALGLGVTLGPGSMLASARRTNRGPTARAASCPTGAAVRVAAAGRMGILGQGSWSWFADPRAVDIDSPYDETIVGWIGWTGNVTVAALDPGCGVQETYVVGHLFHDDHGAPAVVVEPDERITVFWSGHNGRMMNYRTTVNPGDISAWGPVQMIQSRLSGDRGFTYPNPVLLSNEGDKLYLFWRGADYSADYETRGLNGLWSPARTVIHNPGQRPYVKVATNGLGTIAFAYTNGHPRETTTSIYYAAYRGGWLRHADGRRIARLGSGAILPDRGDLVYDGAKRHVSSWVWDVALDPRRRPVIVYATFPSVRNHAYWYARWNGQRWVSHFMTFAGPTISPGTIETEYSGGIALDHSDPSIVYLSRKVNGSFEIEKWDTANGGYTWHHSTIVRTPGTVNVRPVVPGGGGAGLIKLLWLHGHYISYTAYRTSIAYLR